MPIGTPIEGTYVRLLDEDLRPVADGETGTLYAGGLGLASGYVGDARLSARSFVADPERPGALLYRTGDLARRRPDGAFEFVGRRDRQVKIDGKRVEPGEIEEALRRIDGVADAVVTAGRAVDGTPILTAYVKPCFGNGEHETLVSDIRGRLARSLPTHMRPSRVVVLAEFPLTPNGKVDFARLPAPALGPAPARQQGAERVLSEIIARVLGLPDIGSDTNFFDLGATSLKLMEVHAALSRIWPGIDIVALFRHPTVRGLARAIEGRGEPAEIASQRRGRLQADALRRLHRARQAR